jgi:hypothetical protein
MKGRSIADRKRKKKKETDGRVGKEKRERKC